MRKIKRKKDGVVILGCSDRFNFYGAADDFEWWSMNNCYRSHPEVDFTRWFEIHRIEKAGGRFLRRDSANIGEGTVDDYLTDLNGLGIPVYMQRRWREVKRSVEFPLMAVLSRFPRGYFNNSIAWMIGFAIVEGFTEIHVCGLSDPLDDFAEYYVHRLSTEYMLGVAEGLGIKVVVPHNSELLKCKYLYGFQENPHTYAPYVAELNSRAGMYRKDQLERVVWVDHV